MISAIVSALHVLALALGLPSSFFRGRALKGSLDGPGLHRLCTADTVWGIAALLWLATGLARAFGGLEKGSAFYLASPLFWLKITLFATVALLEAWPMATFIRWRRALRRGPGYERSVPPLHHQPCGDGPRGRDRVRRELHGSGVWAPVGDSAHRAGGRALHACA